jgi:hypothetical protein
MEEQKINGKEVKLQPVAGGKKGAENSQEKLPYEKLKEIADSLWNENRYLKQQLQGATEALRTFDRLDYLFKVVDCASKESKFSFHPDFVAKCFDEIEKVMTPPEQKEKKDKEE